MNKFRNKSLYFIISILSLLVIFLALLVVYNNNSPKISALEKMPNYTEIKGKYYVEGFKYEKQPHLGNTDAKVKVIEYADFKCPACKKWKEANRERLKKIMKYFGVFTKKCMYMLDVKEDYKTAGHYGINGTPQFMVNGTLLPDSSYEILAAAIENQLVSK